MLFEKQLFFFSSKERELRKLSSGMYGLSNATLNTDWPKVVNGKTALASLIKNGWNEEAAFNILKNKSIALDDSLPDTGVGLENERMLSPIYIESPVYGTRSSVVMTIDESENVSIAERDYINKKNNGANFKMT